MARAYAFYMDRDYLVPEDIHAVFLSVCSHRVILNTKARAAGLSAEDVLSQVLKSVRIPLLSPARCYERNLPCSVKYSLPQDFSFYI